MSGGAGQPPNNDSEKDKPNEPNPSEPRDGNRRDAGAPQKTAEEKAKADAEKRESAKRDEANRGGAKPNDGATTDPDRPAEPAWLVALPEEYRRMITSGDTEKVPQRYRGLVEAYAKWLSDHAARPAGR